MEVMRDFLPSPIFSPSAGQMFCAEEKGSPMHVRLKLRTSSPSPAISNFLCPAEGLFHYRLTKVAMASCVCWPVRYIHSKNYSELEFFLNRLESQKYAKNNNKIFNIMICFNHTVFVHFYRINNNYI